jgi:hypothetical protein
MAVPECVNGPRIILLARAHILRIQVITSEHILLTTGDILDHSLMYYFLLIFINQHVPLQASNTTCYKFLLHL